MSRRDPDDPHTPLPNPLTTLHNAPTMLEPISPSALQSTVLFISQPVVASFMAGGVAGAVSRTVVSPLGKRTSTERLDGSSRI